jgi:hypothetical protein
MFAFLLFLLLLGALALGIAMSIISALSWFIHLPNRGRGRRLQEK